MNLQMITLFIFSILTSLMTACAPQEIVQEEKEVILDPPYLNADSIQTAWVDSIMDTLTFEEKIGQLFMPYIYSDYGKAHVDAKIDLIKKYNVGGFIWMQGSPANQIKIYNQMQDSAKVPLMFSLDAEAGLGVRLKKAYKFPKQLTLGALQNDSLIYQMGAHIAHQLRMCGVHINFAPVVDVNVNPKNPIINVRSFGEDRELVANKGIAYSNGLQDNKVIACAKHFPGHGDTDKDSHLTLPVINHDSTRLDSIELYPFKRLIKNGVGSMMNAHLFIPTYDTVKNRAASLSPNVVTQLLQNELKFKGLSFTDALNMKGVSQFYEEGEIEVAALEAGNDILLFSMDIKKGMEAVLEAAKTGRLDSTILEGKVRKVLNAKFWLGLNEDYRLPMINLDSALFDDKTLSINQKILEQSITTVRNDSNIIPLSITDESIGFVAFGSQKKKFRHVTSFNFSFEKEFDKHIIHYADTYDLHAEKLRAMRKHKTVVLSFHDVKKYSSGNYGISANAIQIAKRIQKHSNVIIVLFGTPYALKNFNDFGNIIVAYQNDRKTRDITARLLFGHIPSLGKIPVSANEQFPIGTGLTN